MRKCTRCGINKPLTQFYKNKNPRATNGLTPWCKDCFREYQSQPAVKVRMIATEKLSRARNHYSSGKRYRQNNRNKNNAQQKLRYAVKIGRVEKKPCEVCGEKKVHGHHDDYLKPLEVRWLCHIHHMEVHRS